MVSNCCCISPYEDVEKSEPTDPVFQKFPKQADAEFEKLCSEIDERSRLSEAYKTIKNEVCAIKEKL